MNRKPLTRSRKRITKEQTEKLQAAFAAALRQANLLSDEAKKLIDDYWEELKLEFEDVLGGTFKRVLKRHRNAFPVIVEGMRGRTRQELLNATNRKQYVNITALASMPLVPGKRKYREELVWFKTGRSMIEADIERERKKRGLVRDIEMQIEYNAQNPTFADKHPNCDSWKDKNGVWNLIIFRSLHNESKVRVEQTDQRGHSWGPTWYNCGRKVRKRSKR